MTFGLSAAALGGIATAGGGILSSIIGGDAASKAAQQQAAAEMAAINLQKQEFGTLQGLVQPFVNSGQNANTLMSNIAGANGNPAQQAAISSMLSSPIFQGMNQQGQNAILANASATGGLRGGNTNAALAQFSPQLLNQLLQQQFGNLGVLSGQGLQGANALGTLGQSNINQQAGLMTGIGQAQAGGTLGSAQAWNQGANSLVAGLGVYKGLGGTTSSGLTTGGGGYTPTGWTPTVINTY